MIITKDGIRKKRGETVFEVAYDSSTGAYKPFASQVHINVQNESSCYSTRELCYIECGNRNRQIVEGMSAITEKRLIELGFEAEYLPNNEKGRVLDQFEYSKGAICVCRYKNEYTVSVYAAKTKSSAYSREAPGVKTEQDLILLCRLINN